MPNEHHQEGSAPPPPPAQTAGAPIVGQNVPSEPHNQAPIAQISGSPVAVPPNKADAKLDEALELRNKVRKLEYFQIFALTLLPSLATATYPYWSPHLDPILLNSVGDTSTKDIYSAVLTVAGHIGNFVIYTLIKSKVSEAARAFQQYDQLVTNFQATPVNANNSADTLKRHTIAKPTQTYPARALSSRSWYAPAAHSSKKSVTAALLVVRSAVSFDLALLRNLWLNLRTPVYAYLGILLLILLAPSFFPTLAPYSLMNIVLLFTYFAWLIPYFNRYTDQNRCLLELSAELDALPGGKSYDELKAVAIAVTMKLQDMRNSQLWLPERYVYSPFAKGCNTIMDDETAKLAAKLQQYDNPN